MWPFHPDRWMRTLQYKQLLDTWQKSATNQYIKVISKYTYCWTNWKKERERNLQEVYTVFSNIWNWIDLIAMVEPKSVYPDYMNSMSYSG